MSGRSVTSKSTCNVEGLEEHVAPLAGSGKVPAPARALRIRRGATIAAIVLVSAYAFDEIGCWLTGGRGVFSYPQTVFPLLGILVVLTIVSFTVNTRSLVVLILTTWTLYFGHGCFRGIVLSCSRVHETQGHLRLVTVPTVGSNDVTLYPPQPFRPPAYTGSTGLNGDDFRKHDPELDGLILIGDGGRVYNTSTGEVGEITLRRVR